MIVYVKKISERIYEFKFKNKKGRLYADSFNWHIECYWYSNIAGNVGYNLGYNNNISEVLDTLYKLLCIGIWSFRLDKKTYNCIATTVEMRQLYFNNFDMWDGLEQRFEVFDSCIFEEVEKIIVICE